MNKLQKAAEILVECGYATSYEKDGHHWYVEYLYTDNMPCYEKVNPFADTLEGRRQADAIEDWFNHNEEPYKLWCDSDLMTRSVESLSKSVHQWRLDRIKWCLDNLRGSDE